MNRTAWILVSVAAATAVTLRLSDMPTLNFSALGALAVLCGANVRPSWLGLLLVLLTRFITDAGLEIRTGHGWYGSMIFDYAAYALMFALGRSVRPHHPLAIVGTGIAGAATFFLVSNLGVWLMPHEPGQYLYPRTLAGLRLCFVNALPFARGTLAGDIGFVTVFFTAWRLLGAPAIRTESQLAAFSRGES
jgi:hypothetical protein